MDKVVAELIAKTEAELKAAAKPAQKSRTWTHPEGYRYLIPWSNAVLLRFLVVLLTNSLPPGSYKKKAQADDAARSTVRNIEEGYKRANTSPYLEFLSFSQGSLEEVKGDVRDLTQDKLLATRPGSSLKSIGIDLGRFHQALRPKGQLGENKGQLEEATGGYGKTPISSFDHPLTSFIPLEELYPPLARVKPEDLTYEIFIELINKTDYLLRVLVQSLEKRLAQDQKHYQVEQARIKDRLKWRK